MIKDTQEIQMTQSQNPNIKLEVDDRVLNSLKDYRINKIKKGNIDSKLSKSKSR